MISSQKTFQDLVWVYLWLNRILSYLSMHQASPAKMLKPSGWSFLCACVHQMIELVAQMEYGVPASPTSHALKQARGTAEASVMPHRWQMPLSRPKCLHLTISSPPTRARLLTSSSTLYKLNSDGLLSPGVFNDNSITSLLERQTSANSATCLQIM